MILALKIYINFNSYFIVIFRTPGSKLSLADAETRRLWHAEYGECFPAAGLMYRGEPPRGKMSKCEAGCVSCDNYICNVHICKVTCFLKVDDAQRSEHNEEGVGGF